MNYNQRKKENKISIINYLGYESVVSTLRGKSSKYILKNQKNIEKEINKRIKLFAPVSVIGYSSFLNMFCQTITTDNQIKQGKIEIKECGLAAKEKIEKIDGIILHRFTLLYFISQIILRNVKGKKIVTDANSNPNNKKNAKKYYETLLLMNYSGPFRQDTKKCLKRYNFKINF